MMKRQLGGIMLTMASSLRVSSCLSRQHRFIAHIGLKLQARSAVLQGMNQHQEPSRRAAGRLQYSLDSGDDLWYPPSLMDHMLYRIKEVNKVPYNLGLINFTINGRVLGKVTPKVAEMLSSLGPEFELSTGTNTPTFTLSNAAGSTVEQRTQSVARVMEELRDSGYITGWRDELYPVAESFDSPPIFLVERAASSLLGVLEYGVHINGLVVDEEDGTTKMWMARRSRTKSKFPGYLDHIVAGGQPAGLSLMDNCIKECTEEAGIPPDVTRRGIRPAGAISYECYGGSRASEGEGFMSRVVLFCFDLMLPSDFVPTANDGEVESFFKWSIDEVGRSMDPEYDDPIKPNCYPVIIDYLLRSGAISPDSPGYLDILRTLRSGTCS